MIESFRVTSVQYNEKGYTIFSGIPLEKKSVSIKSARYIVTVKSEVNKLPVPPSIGQIWEVDASFITTNDISKDGYKLMQYTYSNIVYVKCTLPNHGEQLIQFIAKEKDFAGIGEQKARLVWQKLGNEFHPIISKDTHENRLLLKDLLTDTSINSLFVGYKKYKNLSSYCWMTNHKIPILIQQRLLKHHNDNCVNAIKKNPYTLTAFGMSFSEADKLAIDKFNILFDDERRLSSAVEMSIMAEVGKGHTYTSQQDILPAVKRSLGSLKLANKAFSAAYNNYQFLHDKEGNTYHPTAQILMETVVAKRFVKLNSIRNSFNEKAFVEAKSELPYDLTDKQEEAVITSLDNAISCVTGGAGTGKTTVLRTILRAYYKQGVDIHAVALSGRAAMRLNESIGFDTFTIAAFLKEKPLAPDLISPDHLLVIDEASMIDLPTMYRLVTHIHPSVRLILTGDPDQLPPIGCGKVLSDVVDSKVVSNTRLDIVKRQEGSTGIPEYSQMINAGVIPESLSFGAIHFHETHPDKIAEKCTDLFVQSPKNSRLMGSTKIMVEDINQRCQSAVNPYSERLEFDLNGERFFRNIKLNDVILFTKNNFKKGIQNGTLGVLTSLEKTEQTEFMEQSFGEVRLDNDDVIQITQEILDCMELGYCITLHKAQGSQFPRIIIALKKGRITDRAWIYTAITRAESEVHIVGTAKDFVAIIKEISHANKRNSYLKNVLIREDQRSGLTSPS